MCLVPKVTGQKPKLVFSNANKYLDVTFVFDDGQHFSAHKGFKHHLYKRNWNFQLIGSGGLVTDDFAN